MPRIAAAVASLEPMMEIIVPVGLFGPIRLLELLGDAIAFGINIWPNMVSYLSGRVTQTDALVERCRAQPEGTIVFHFVRAPEPHVMPLPRTVSDGLLEGKVLLAPEQEQTTYRSLVIWPPQSGINHDPDAAAESDPMGGIPSNRCHRPDDLSPRANEGNIDRVARMPIGGVRDAIDIGKGRMMPKIDPPNQR